MNNISEVDLGVLTWQRNKVDSLISGCDGETEVERKDEVKSSALVIEAVRLPAAVCGSELCKMQI